MEYLHRDFSCVASALTGRRRRRTARSPPILPGEEEDSAVEEQEDNTQTIQPEEDGASEQACGEEVEDFSGC